MGSNPVAVTSDTSDIAPISSKEFIDLQGTIECRFTLRRVRDIITCSHTFYNRFKEMSDVSAPYLTRTWNNEIIEKTSIFRQPETSRCNTYV